MGVVTTNNRIVYLLVNATFGSDRLLGKHVV